MSKMNARVWLMISMVLLTLVPARFGSYAIAQETPVLPLEVEVSRGVDLTIQGLAEMELEPIDAPHLVVERYIFDAGSAFGPYTPSGPQMLVLEEGEVQITDERGFRQALQPPFQIVVQPGDEVSWTFGERSSLTMMGFVSGSGVPPIPATETERIAAFPLENVPPGRQQVFYGLLEIDANAPSITLNHDGLVALQVRDGSLETVSPSGLGGTLGEGGSIVFPADVPIQVLGTNDEDAVVVLAGIGRFPSADAAFTVDVDDPCATSSIPCTDPGETLANGGNWVGANESPRINVSNTSTGVAVGFTYRNRGNETVEFYVHADDIRVQWANGIEWNTPADRSLVTVEPGQTSSVTWNFDPPRSDGWGTIVVQVHEFGEIQDAEWRVRLD